MNKPEIIRKNKIDLKFQIFIYIYTLYKFKKIKDTWIIFNNILQL